MSDTVLEHRVEVLEALSEKLTDAVMRLTRMEESNKSSNATVVDHEARLRAVETELPTMKLTRGWVIGGVIGVWSVLAAVCVGLFVWWVKSQAGL